MTIYSLDCPSTTECTAVDLRGQEVTFDPQNPGSPTPVAIVNNHALLSVSCPSTTQCTAVDDDQYEATFNPQSPTTGRYASLGTQSEASITSVSCPTVTQCTAVDAVGEQATFNPQNPGTPKPTTVLPDGAVAVSCPTVSRCTAIDLSGLQATFDPTAPAVANSATVDSSQPSALVCPVATFCVAIDAAGHAVEFDPGSTGATAVDNVGSGGTLSDLACVSAGECVTVDSTGHAYLGEGPIPLVPVAASLPGIAGVLKQGETLQETHGNWSGPPTSYAYQWERCTSASSCLPIAGAVGQSYTLVAADAGHLIRVSEQAADAGGFGAPVVSAATAKVTGLPEAPSVSHLRLTGVAARRPGLQLTLTAAPYGPKLRDWTLSLPRSLSVHLRSIGPRKNGRWKGITIKVSGKKQRFSAHLTHRVLAVGLKRTVGALKISIGGAALTASKSLIRSARRHKRTKLGFTIAVRSTTHQLLRATETLNAF